VLCRSAFGESRQPRYFRESQLAPSRGIRLTSLSSWPSRRIPGSIRCSNSIRPLATSAVARILVWRAGGTLAARAATWPRRIGKANFESANSRSRNWRRSRRQAISIPLGSSVFAFDGSPGLIRVYHGSGNNWIDLRYDSIEQPEWEPVFGLSSTRLANGSFHR
jgi:hypothetical protein